MQMMKVLMAKPGGAGARRHGDPRSHLTVCDEEADAGIYKREALLGGKVIPDEAATTRKGVAAAQDLCRQVSTPCVPLETPLD